VLNDVSLASSIHHLGSDADYCGLGEEYSSQGQFRGVENSYYLGGGTGVADALKLRGRLVPFDAIKSWMAKTWEMKAESGKSLERYCSAAGIQSIYSEYSGISLAELNQQKIYAPQIMEKAIRGEEAASKTMKDISHYLAELLFERISTLYAGSNNPFEFVNPARTQLISRHPYMGTLLDKIIIGQRLGDYLQASRGKNQMWEPMIRHLGELILENENLTKEFKRHYLKHNTFNENRIVLSKLREAPALGAAVDAWLSMEG
jgi:predicted NBD/HSP70 family sugar kinase